MAIALLGFQTKIAAPLTLTGIGVHSGRDVTITLQPAEAGTGIVFQRQHDDGSTSEYRAVSAHVGNTDLCTVLGTNPARSIATIEHVMAALYALGLDNVIVEVDGAEMPIMDGSSEVFIDAIEQVGIASLGVKRRYIRVTKPVRIESGASWSEFRPYDGTRFEVEIDFDSKLIGRQRPSKPNCRGRALSASCVMSNVSGPPVSRSVPRSKTPWSSRTTTLSSMSRGCGTRRTSSSVTRRWMPWATWLWPAPSSSAATAPIVAVTR